jgi:hypothetical protein
LISAYREVWRELNNVEPLRRTTADPGWISPEVEAEFLLLATFAQDLKTLRTFAGTPA